MVNFWMAGNFGSLSHDYSGAMDNRVPSGGHPRTPGEPSALPALLSLTTPAQPLPTTF